MAEIPTDLEETIWNLKWQLLQIIHGETLA